MWWLSAVALATLRGAQAATPTPDRPSVSRSGFLVAPDTLELELGARWAEGRSVPATLKYAIGAVVEPRISANLAGVESGSPGLEAGLKVRLLDQGRTGVALYAGSAVPVTAEEPWSGEVHGLCTTDFGHGIGLQADAGIDLVGEPGGGVAFGGVPIAGALLIGPAARASLFAELAGEVGGPGCEGRTCAFGQLVLDGGARFRLTEILVVDGAAGWDLAAQQPFATVGLAANFGSVQ